MNKSLFLRIAAIVVVIAIAVACATLLPLQDVLTAVLSGIRDLGVWGPVLLACVYILACIFFLPGSPLTLAAGFSFGFLWGYISVTIGSVLGATAAFLLGRYLARGWVESWIGDHRRFLALDEAVEKQGFRIVLLTRLSPAFPFNLLNYAFGLTRVSLGDYFWGSWLGMIPGTVMYVYLGTGLKSLTEAASGEVQGGPMRQWLFAVGLVATIAATVVLARLAKSALSDVVGDREVDQHPTP